MFDMTPEEAYNFVVNLGLKRHEKSELIIMTDPYYAYTYALKIIKGRWLEGEPYIMEDSFWWDIYKSRFDINE